MTQIKHTPGPWRTVTDGISHWVEVDDKIIMVTKSNAKANARLIAAAPELLAALIEAVEFADQDFQALTPAGDAMIQKWRAAIAKAEG